MKNWSLETSYPDGKLRQGNNITPPPPPPSTKDTLEDIKFDIGGKRGSKNKPARIQATLNGERMIDIKDEIIVDPQKYWYQVFEIESGDVLLEPCTKVELDQYLNMLTDEERLLIEIVKVNSKSEII